MTAVTPFLLTHNNMQGGFRLMISQCSISLDTFPLYAEEVVSKSTVSWFGIFIAFTVLKTMY